MRYSRVLIVLLLLMLAAGRSFAQETAPAPGVEPGPLSIEWEVKNRFRLFRSEADFQRHVAAFRDDGILGAERRLSIESDGRGWARDTVERLCVDRAGKLMDTCERDGVRESYLTPRDHRIGVVLAGTLPADLDCVWTFNDGTDEPRQITVPCEEEVTLRVAYGKPTVASVDVILPDNTAKRVVTEIAVRDVLIAGIGDSIAAGDGNPDRAVQISDTGFCFRRFLRSSSSEYYRPGREGFTGNKTCTSDVSENASTAWARQSARWESAPCHRSLYSYQLRTALALAVENPRLAVTFLPLACSGATIDDGLFGDQSIRECARPGTNTACPNWSRAQLAELKDILARARRARADRTLDLMLLTIGANDIQFAALVGHVIIDSTTERLLFGRGGHITTADESRRILDNDLPGDFAKLRAALKPLVGGDLGRVVFVSYGHPALAAPGKACPGGRDGFDVHPAFAADGGRLREVADFVSDQFLPKIKALAVCGGKLCRDPEKDRMTFVDAHQAAFAEHGVCARADTDPDFDRSCFSQKGTTFNPDPATAATDPMACDRLPSDYRPYLPRQRWVRTANDSYFTAMSFPQGMGSTLQPANIHDATWGILSAVHGGAIHPTAEGHAAMADAALASVRHVLGLTPIAQPPAGDRQQPTTPAPTVMQ